MPAAWNGSTTSGGWVFFGIRKVVGEGGWGLHGCSSCGRQNNTQHKETATHICCCSWYTTLLRQKKTLSLSRRERGFVLSFCGLGRSFRNDCSFFPIFPARRIHKNSLKRQLVNEIYYCHRYALCCFSYAFPIRTFSSVTHTHTFLGRENHSDYDTWCFGFSLAGRAARLQSNRWPPRQLSIVGRGGNCNCMLSNSETLVFRFSIFHFHLRCPRTLTYLLTLYANCQEIAAAAWLFYYFPVNRAALFLRPAVNDMLRAAFVTFCQISLVRGLPVHFSSVLWRCRLDSSPIPTPLPPPPLRPTTECSQRTLTQLVPQPKSHSPRPFARSRPVSLRPPRAVSVCQLLRTGAWLFVFWGHQGHIGQTYWHLWKNI